MHRGKRAGFVLTAGLALLLSVSGCAGKTETTKEAMALIEEMDYEGALALLSQAWAEQGHPAEGEEEAKKPGDAGESYGIYRGMGIAYMGLTRYEEAIECFLSALACSDGLIKNVDFDVNYYLAAAYSRSGRFAEAKEVYDSILALRPQEQEAYFQRGNVELELNQYTQAKEDFDRVVAMDPQNYDRLLAIYEVFAHFGYKAAGQEYLQTVLEDGAKTLSAFDKGRIYFYMEDYQKAYVELEEAKSDGTARSNLFLGKAYEATGDYNYACNVYRSYLDKQGDSAEMYNQLGICELKRMNYKEALAAFQAGLALQDKEMQQVLSFNEIVAYEYLSDFEKASSLIQTYVRRYPDDAKAVREQQFLSTRQAGE